MTWALAIALAAVTWLAIVLLFKASRKGWEAIAAALLLGIAGYGMQASPGLPGAPKPAAETISDDPGALVKAREGLSERSLPATNRWLVIADALARNGQYANAAQVLLGAVKNDPDDSEAWLALANALVAHADGLLTPASRYAYGQAERADPDSAGPPFFLGLALAQSGRFGEARDSWAGLLERAPDDAPWRKDLARQLERLDALIAAQQAAQVQK